MSAYNKEPLLTNFAHSLDTGCISAEERKLLGLQKEKPRNKQGSIFPGPHSRGRPIPPLTSPLLPSPPLLVPSHPDATLPSLCAPAHPLSARPSPAHLPGLHTWVRQPPESRPRSAKPGDSGVPPPARPRRRAAMFTEGKWINPQPLRIRDSGSKRKEHGAEGAVTGRPSLKGEKEKGVVSPPRTRTGAHREER